MASQQGAPARPWFRLATMVRPPPAAPTPQPDQPPPAPAPAPRPPFIRPAFSQTFRAPPAAPPPPPPSPPTPPPPPPPAASPPKPPVSPSTTVPQEPRPMPSPQSPPPPPTRSIPPSLTTTTTRAATPTSSPPKTVKPLEKTPPPSPTIKPISHPPSPLTLPSPQLNSNHRNHPEYEQKAVLVQETKQKTKALDNAFNGEIPKHMGWTAHNHPKTDATKKSQTSKKNSDSEDSGIRIITIAGENKGAVMDFSPFPNKTHMFGNNPHSLHIKKENPTASSDGNKSGTDSDGSSKANKKNQKSASQLMTAFMNSNVQGVNNSILYNSSTTHHDPGVHLSLSRKPNGSRGFHIKDHKDRIN